MSLYVIVITCLMNSCVLAPGWDNGVAQVKFEDADSCERTLGVNRANWQGQMPGAQFQCVAESNISITKFQ